MKRLFYPLLFVFMVLSSGAVALPAHHWHKSMIPGKPSLRGSAVYGNSLWVSGTDNSVFVSHDKGRTWQDVSVKQQPATDFRDIALFDEKTAIVMGVGTGPASTLYKTTDGGKSWQRWFVNPDKDGFFDSIAFWDRQNGLLLGDPVDGYYVIMKTSDGGKHFTRIDRAGLPAAKDKEAAFAASGNTLIVGSGGKAWFTTGGFSAQVYASQDYGKTWLRQSVPLHDKTATSGGYGLALNDQGTIFVVGGDYQQRDGKYTHIAYLGSKGKWMAPKGDTDSGLRTAMGCIGRLCINTGKRFTGLSTDGGKQWELMAFEGYYTLATGSGLFLMAGHDGRVGVLTF